MKLPNNPVEFTTAGQHYDDSCRILAVVWEGVTVAGDTAELLFQSPTKRFWRGRTNDSNTYLGINWGPYGVHAPNGFIMGPISSGTILVYLSEA